MRTFDFIIWLKWALSEVHKQMTLIILESWYSRKKVAKNKQKFVSKFYAFLLVSKITAKIQQAPLCLGLYQLNAFN